MISPTVVCVCRVFAGRSLMTCISDGAPSFAADRDDQGASSRSVGNFLVVGQCARGEGSGVE